MAEYKVVNATQLDNDLKSICDTIRSVENSEFVDRQIPFPNGFKQAITITCENRYWDGHRVGAREGRHYAAEQAQNFGNRKDYSYWRAAEDITDLKIPLPMKPTACAYMFSSAITNDGSTIDLSQYDIDFSPCTNFTYWLNNSPINKIGVLDTTSCSNPSTLLTNARNLITINKLILKEDGSQTLGSAFGQNTYALQNINEIEGYFGSSFSFTWNDVLTHDTLVRIIEHLKDYSGTSTEPVLTIGTANQTKLTQAEKTLIESKGWDLG